MRKIKITNKKFRFEDDIEELTEGIVKQIGNGGMILSSKKYIGKKVYVLIRKEQLSDTAGLSIYNMEQNQFKNIIFFKYQYNLDKYQK